MSPTCRLLATRTRWLQFGVRAIFFWTTVIGIALGVFLQRVRQQTIAVRAILARGGVVHYKTRQPDSVASRGQWRKWLEKSLGKDFFGRVIHLELDSSFDDASLSYVAQLRDLEAILFFGDASRVTDTGMQGLAGLVGLTSLDAPGSQVTDRSLRSLAALPGLVDIGLDEAQISDAGLAYLERRRDLQALSIRNARGVTDDGMRSISLCDELTYLKLGGTSITSKGLRYLSNLKLLELLDLSDNPAIDGEGLKHLRHLKRLEVLNLSNCPAIGDAGLTSLSEMSALNELNLRNTNITSKGLRCLTRLRGVRVLDLSDNVGVTDDGINWLSQLTGIEMLKLRNTGITSEGVRRLGPLAKLEFLDVSENGEIGEDALSYLGDLSALKCLDLHNTEVMRRGTVAAESLSQLRRLRRLSLLDVSGTGVGVERVDDVLSAGSVIGSRASSNVGPGMQGFASYTSIDAEALGITIGIGEGADPSYFDGASHFFREETLSGALDRMLALCAAEGIAHSFAEQRPVVQRLHRRADELGYRAEAERAALFSDFVAAMRRNSWLKRLYAAGSDLQFADAMQAHLEFLERVKREWALTDVELNEFVDAQRNVRIFLCHAGLNLGLQTGSGSQQSSEEIIAIWRQTRAVPKEPAKISCWEGMQTGRGN